MKLAHLVFLLFAFLAISKGVFAQATKGEIKGKIMEGTSKKPLPYTTVAVYRAQDTTLLTFRVSDEKGNFRVPGLPLQINLRVVASMVGFATYRKEFMLTPQEPVIDIGEVAMGESNLLKEVVITAEIPPVVVRKDTLEFNAASFKTLPTSLVEDLLRKMPGVNVDSNGNITVNGKEVKRILVDGKAFFGSDPKIATRNLPADIIDKVQVMNDPDELRENPNLPANQIPQVINLTFKKGIKKGLFGKLYAGGGSRERYESGGILNMFRDTTQLSLIGFSNNLNRPAFGFEEISRIGGFNRSGITSGMSRSDGGFALNGISFGGTGEGIQQTSGGGGNFNTVTGKNLKVNLMYFFGNMNSNLFQRSNSEQFINDNIIRSGSIREQFTNSNTHRIQGRLEWKFNPGTILQITPHITLNQNFANQLRSNSTEQNTLGRLNQSTNQEKNNNNLNNYATILFFNKNFKKAGRTLNFFGNYYYEDNVTDQYNKATNEFYRPQVYTTFLDQLRINDRPNIFVKQAGYYSEPINKTLTAIMRFRAEYIKDRNGVNTFQREPNTPNFDEPVPDLTDFVNRQAWRWALNPSLRWAWPQKRMEFMTSLDFYDVRVKNTYLRNPEINQRYFYVFPAFNFNWKDLSINYSNSVDEPPAVDLQTVRNNTNPLFLQLGNPNLTPNINNMINIFYRKYNTQRMLTYNFNISGRRSQDYFIQERTLSPEGIQTLRPVNIDGVWAGNVFTGIRKDYKFNDKNQFSVGSNLYMWYNRSFVLLNNEKSESNIWNLTPSLDSRLNLDNKLEFGQNFSVTRQVSSYENNVFNNQQLTYYTWRSELVVRMPKKLVWEANINYRNNPNVPPGFQKSFTFLNAGVTYLFMKNDRAQLKLSVYDLLNQNVGFYRSIRENIIEDIQTTILNRYGLLTFTYNIRNFSGKAGGTNTLFRF
ncbi:outer membrane beta-barrel protein [Adhaeribacter aquaticus]|uniref:outer membrane beta-barrel protein n=1 Tax=Adhaeribacter aquaticus TaxID=299567 RepID=UPI0004086085|nr:outer membrane beta-barrel protein [Adhaeribacter aquaticus]